MNRLINTIALATSLFAIQGCSTLITDRLTSSELLTATEATHQDTHSHSGRNHHNARATNETRHTTARNSTKATLTLPDKISPNTPVPMTINVRDSAGKVIRDFEVFQEKLMHLIVVSNDLQVFQHLHPTYHSNRDFSLNTKFPQAGGYTLFADYQPTGIREQVSVLQVNVPGKAPEAEAIRFNRTKTIGNTETSLEFSQPTVIAGQEVTVTLHLKDATTRQPVTDLRPYLGEAGHLVILRHSPSLTQADYIHAHALENPPAGQISFATHFPEPGHYKLWGQFDRGGEIIAADFWVEVQAAQ